MRRTRPSCCAARRLAVESAKSAGRGGAAAYGRALESDGLSRLAMESDLRGAIGRGEIVPFFQPVVRLSTGAIAGFEALARWRHPRRGVMAPDEFLPLCEEMGLMAELGDPHDGRGRPPAGRLARAPTARPARSASASTSRPARSTATSWSTTSPRSCARPACRAGR